MRILLTILLCALWSIVIGQLPANTFPTQNSTGYFIHGWDKSDSGNISAVRDTFYARYIGTRILRISGGDTSEWFYGGNRRWFKALKQGDIPQNTFVQNGNSFGDSARLGTNDNFPLLLETNNTRRGILTTNGWLGLGTLSPSSLLDVNGIGSFSDSLRVKNVIEVGDASINGLMNFKRAGSGLTIGQIFPNGNELNIVANAGTMQLQGGSVPKLTVRTSGVTIGANSNASFASILEQAYLILQPGDSSTNRGGPLKFTLDGARVLNVKQRGVMEAKSNYLMWTDSLLNRDTLATRRWVYTVAGSNQNFANTNLTLTGNRDHAFGTNRMRFNFEYSLGNDGYIGFNEATRPGITIYSKSDNEIPGIHFIDPDALGINSHLFNFLGTIGLNSNGISGSGNIGAGPNSLSLSIIDAAVHQKSIVFKPSFGQLGIRVQDQQDSSGFAYDTISIPANIAVSKVGRSWVPNWGAVLDTIAAAVAGGGGGGTLQTITDAGNETTNAIVITDLNNYTGKGNGLYFFHAPSAISEIYSGDADAGTKLPLTIEGSNITIQGSGSLAFNGVGATVFNTVVRGLNAVGSTDFVTLAQLTALGNTLYTGNGTLTGARTITMAGNNINFSGGKLGIDIAPLYDLHVENATATITQINTTALGATSGGVLREYVKALPNASGQRLGYISFGSAGGGTNDYEGGGISVVSRASWTGGSSHSSSMAFLVTASGNSTPSVAGTAAGGGRWFLGGSTISTDAWLQLAAGTTSTVPLKFVSGTDPSSPNAGMVAFNGTRWAFSPSTTLLRLPLFNDVTPTAGGILQGNGTNFTLLALGTAGQSVRVNAGATALEYVNPNYTLLFSDTSITTVANTTTESTLLGNGVGSLSFAGTSLVPGSVITWKGSGNVSTAASAGTPTYSFTIGSVTAAINCTGLSNSITNGNYEYEFEVYQFMTGVNKDCFYKIKVDIIDNGVIKRYAVTGLLPATFSSAGTITCNVTGDWNTADPSNSIVSHGNTLEVKLRQ